ncbi:acetyltransferase [Arachidicoccus sp.]|uniref:acetyltransferase n=1 Tax=Arachidicoccus sp. TaxID=1872624 RepID=UPI003D1975D7
MGYYLIGAGGHGMVIIDIILSSGGEVLGLFDKDISKGRLLDIPLYYWGDHKMGKDDFLIISIGNNKIRKRLAVENRNELFGKAIHPSSNVSNYASVDIGTVIMSGVSINAATSIGKHTIVNTNACIDHECIIKDFVHISPNATLCGNVTIGEGAHIGAGAILIPGVKVGKWATIGAGAVIINDVPDLATVVGNPGKVIKINKNEWS